MQHKGEIVEKAIRESGYSITKVVEKLGKSRRWIYHLFQNPNAPIDFILEIGKIIHHDFYSEVDELKPVALANAINGSNEETIDYWKNKYYKLMEDHHELIKKHND
jgi:predicted transcriptional regulator